MRYNGRLSLKILEKSVKVQNLPYPLLRGQPLKRSLKKNQGSNEIRTRDLRDIGAMLCQLSYEATHLLLNIY